MLQGTQRFARGGGLASRTTGVGEFRALTSDAAQARLILPMGRGDDMTWETPTFVEIEMNAEIGAYQGDYDGV